METINVINVGGVDKEIEDTVARNTNTTQSGQIQALSSDIQALTTNLNGEISARSSADALLQAEIDQLVAPSGEAPSAAEVENARIAADGVTYNTLGNAIRDQISEVDGLKQDKLFDIKSFLGTRTQYSMTTSGTLASAGYRKEITVSEGDILFVTGYSFSATVPLYLIFDSSNNLLRSFGTANTLYSDFIPVYIPEHGAKLVVNYNANNDTNFRIYNTYTKDLLNTFVEQTFIKDESVGTVVQYAMQVSGVPSSVGWRKELDVTAGEKYVVSGYGYNINTPLIVVFDNNGDDVLSYGAVNGTYTDIPVIIPADGVKLVVNNTNQTSVKIYSTKGNIPFKNSLVSSDGYLPSCDLDDIVYDNAFYYLDSTQTYSNMPDASYTNGFLHTMFTGGYTFQLFYAWDGVTVLERRRKEGGTWSTWQTISGGSSITINVSPHITTDTNQYLASTNDSTDRTAAIIALLTDTGACHLGPGVFYVSNIDMPANSIIDGCGADTQLIRSGTDNGYAIKLNSYCTVKDLWIRGKTSDVSISATVGNRHGIVWEGNYDQTQDYSQQPVRCFINNVFISNFTGAAIKCNNTGSGNWQNVIADNAHVWNCSAGIYIPFQSEYHKFSNIHVNSCYYGVVNNGGNNMFSLCDFSNNKLGCLMDNTNNQSPNNTHGSMIGCVFNHTDNNHGVGVKIINCKNGYVFDGCQIFFSQIYLEDTNGIIFNACDFGNMNTDITIVGGGAILFSNNMHQAVPPISIDNNNNVHFVNSYVRSTGAIVAP